MVPPATGSQGTDREFCIRTSRGQHQPGVPQLPAGHHIDGGLSLDARSAQRTAAQNSWAQAIRRAQPPRQLGLQARATCLSALLFSALL
uniref:Uncharacterized protein n=1 Tax=Ficedula albicollis TaxID=59894 RepID=A0A803W6B8_FICAL